MKPDFVPEDVVLRALKILEDKNIIAHFFQAEKNGQIDRDGIDFLIFLENGLCLPLQVKRGKKALASHFRKHPHVKFVIIVSRDRPERIANSIRRMICKIPELKKPLGRILMRNT
ncbi:MAG: hypothetical protein AAB617_00770 [Patescibacteria group bacterium]